MSPRTDSASDPFQQASAEAKEDQQQLQSAKSQHARRRQRTLVRTGDFLAQRSSRHSLRLKRLRRAGVQMPLRERRPREQRIVALFALARSVGQRSATRLSSSEEDRFDLGGLECFAADFAVLYERPELNQVHARAAAAPIALRLLATHLHHSRLKRIDTHSE